MSFVVKDARFIALSAIFPYFFSCTYMDGADMSEASVSRFCCRLHFRNTNKSTLITAYFNNATVAFSFYIQWRSCFGLHYINFLLQGTAKRAKFSTNCLKTLYRPRKKRKSVCTVRLLSFATASAVSFASTRRPGGLTWSLLSITLANKVHSCSLGTTPASNSCRNTRITRSKWAIGIFENTTMCSNYARKGSRRTEARLKCLSHCKISWTFMNPSGILINLH